MKKLIIINIIIAITLLTACDDIVNSDRKILITEIEYTKVLEDQENNVIMPLKKGNKWYYDVTEYDRNNNITRTLLDSIFVYEEVIVDNEKWFEVHFPIHSYGKVLLTNTDQGLWLKCTSCEDKSFLLARYPQIDKKFASGHPNINSIPTIDNSNNNDFADLVISKSIEKENITIPLGNFETLRYESGFESDDNSYSDFANSIEYYTIGQGLQKFVQNYLLSNNVNRIYTRRSPPSPDFTNCKETIFKSNLTPKRNQATPYIVKLENKTNQSMVIVSLLVEDISQGDIVTFPSEFDNPVTIQANSSKDLELTLLPNDNAIFNTVIKVLSSNECLFEITLDGRAIK